MSNDDNVIRGVTGGIVSGTISAIKRETASDITRNIISAFAGGAMLGLSPETTIPKLLAAGTLSGAVVNIQINI